MSVTGAIEISTLNQRVVLNKVIATVSSQLTVWARVEAFPGLTYWTSGALGFLIRTPSQIPSEDEWPNWYFTFGGKNYYWYQFWLDTDSHGQFLFVEAHAASFGSSPSTFPASNVMYNSDAAAAADGLSIGDPYWAGAAHDRTPYGSLTQRLE